MTDNKIGYGKPPKATRFKPGQSGNPHGRPKGSKNTYNLLRNVLNQKVTVTTAENGETHLTKQQAILLQVANLAAKGDIKAISVIIPHMLKMDEKEEMRDALIKQTNTDDQQILELWMKNNGFERKSSTNDIKD